MGQIILKIYLLLHSKAFIAVINTMLLCFLPLIYQFCFSSLSFVQDLVQDTNLFNEKIYLFKKVKLKSSLHVRIVQIFISPAQHICCENLNCFSTRFYTRPRSCVFISVSRGTTVTWVGFVSIHLSLEHNVTV